MPCKLPIVILALLLASCSTEYRPTSYYDRFYEYPEYQRGWPLFNYFLPTYPQFYWGYYVNPYRGVVHYDRDGRLDRNNFPRNNNRVHDTTRVGVRRFR